MTASSTSSAGLFRHLDRFLRTHRTLGSRMLALAPEWPQSDGVEVFLLMAGLASLAPLIIFYVQFFEGYSQQGWAAFQPFQWATAIYGGLDTALIAVSSFITQMVLLPVRGLSATLAAAMVTVWLAVPFALAVLVIVPICADCTFKKLVSLPPVVIRLLDYLFLPAVLHIITSYFSLSLFYPITAYFTPLYLFLTVTALFNLAPLHFIVRVLAKAEEALASLGDEPVGRSSTAAEGGGEKVEELQGELKRLMQEVQRLKAKNDI
ncbi:hypothetical protein JCM11251_000015 [Rhodosporidiobolus azoricus]